jgi:hypothetical protein
MAIRRLFIVMTAICGAAIGAGWWAIGTPVPQTEPVVASAAHPESAAAAVLQDAPHATSAVSSQSLLLPAAASPVAPVPAIREPDVVSSTPSIPGDLNANLRSVVAAARSGTNSERLTPLIAPAAYDHQRFLANPKSYLDVVEPGRTFQSAEPGEAVPQLKLIGSALATIPQGGRTELRVRTVPGAPTTFTSFECSAFDNHLTSITVQADAEGIASATFHAPPGTLNDVSILAGSLLASGQVNFCVTVTPP